MKILVLKLELQSSESFFVLLYVGTYKVCIEKCPDHFFTFLDMASDQETQAKIMVRIKSYTLETSIVNIE